MALVATDPSRPWRSLAVSRPDGPVADPSVNDLVRSPGRRRGSRPRHPRRWPWPWTATGRGMTEPLALFPTFSWYLYHRGKSARGRLATGYPFPEDGDHLAVRLAFGNRDFDGITGLAAPPHRPPRRARPGLAVRHLPPPDHRPVDHGTTDDR